MTVSDQERAHFWCVLSIGAFGIGAIAVDNRLQYAIFFSGIFSSRVGFIHDGQMLFI